MELLSFLSYSFLVLLILHSLALFRKRNLPPGPLGLPIFGNLFDIGLHPHESITKLARTYGPLMTIRQGSVITIVASSAEMAKQVLQKHDVAFSGRMIPDAISQLDHPAHAIAWLPSGDQWRLIRKLLHALLTNTQKLDTLRELRYNVMQDMVEHVKQVSQSDKGIGISKLAFTTAINQLSRTCFSENVAEYDSKDANEFKSAVTTIMEITGKFNLVDYFPLLKGFDPQRMRPKAKAAYGCLEVLCDKYIYQRLRHRESNLPRHGDFLDSLLDFSEENESDFKLKHIQALLVDMFLAGTETTTYTTEWVITQLILHPDVMIKLRNEIRQTVMVKGRIDEAQILGLPYLQAVIKETMRLRFAVPFLLPHKTEMDVNLNGYFIPKNTQVLVNAWAIARDPELWENPSAFMPERFLYKEMDFSGQHFEFLPFGSGRRICPGMPVAHRVVSLMIASLVHHFDWELPNGMKPEQLDLRQTFGLTLQRANPLLAVPRILKEESI